MPVIKAVNESYPAPKDLYNLLCYIGKGYVFGLGIDPAYCYEQMMLVKDLWHKTNGRQCRHFIVSFDNTEELSFDEAVKYGFEIAAYYSASYQIVFALHLDPQFHLHFVMNSTSYVDGRKYSGSLEDYYKLRQHIKELNPSWQVSFTQE